MQNKTTEINSPIFKNRKNIIQKNSVTLTHMGQNKCQIIEYSKLSDNTYMD